MEDGAEAKGGGRDAPQRGGRWDIGYRNQAARKRRGRWEMGDGNQDRGKEALQNGGFRIKDYGLRRTEGGMRPRGAEDGI
jgi:hypothetical protein